MKRYLQQLHADIEFAAMQAPQPPESTWFAHQTEDDDVKLMPRFTKLCDLFQLSPYAFPPEKMLTDLQFQKLFSALLNLLHFWRVEWSAPPHLSDRKIYSAMLREIAGEPILWHPEIGGHIEICRFGENNSCPFGPEFSYCSCRSNSRKASQDMDPGKNHGRHPHHEKPTNEDVVDEQELMIRELQIIYGDDWEKFTDVEFFDNENFDATENFQNGKQLANDFLYDLFLEDYDEPDDDTPPPHEDNREE